MDGIATRPRLRAVAAEIRLRLVAQSFTSPLRTSPELWMRSIGLVYIHAVRNTRSSDLP